MGEVIRGPYLADLLVQPAAVQATLAGLAADAAVHEVVMRFQAGAFRRIVLTGMGSSLHALHPLAIRLASQGAIVIDASELIHASSALVDAGTLVVAVSQSGRSAEIVRLLERGGAGAILGVTNTAGSPLATEATAALVTRAGDEATVSCKTYVAGLAALAFLGDVLLRESTHATLTVPLSMQAYLDGWEAHVAELMTLTAGVRDVFVAGRGPSLAAAYTAGLILKESTRLHAEGMTSAALRHGPLEMSADHVFALVYEGESNVAALNAALVADLLRAGARAALIGPSATHAFAKLPAVNATARPFLEILPAQMLSLALAAHAGIEAGRFLHATKVTATE